MSAMPLSLQHGPMATLPRTVRCWSYSSPPSPTPTSRVCGPIAQRLGMVGNPSPPHVHLLTPALVPEKGVFSRHERGDRGHRSCMEICVQVLMSVTWGSYNQNYTATSSCPKPRLRRGLLKMAQPLRGLAGLASWKFPDTWTSKQAPCTLNPKHSQHSQP